MQYFIEHAILSSTDISRNMVYFSNDDEDKQLTVQQCYDFVSCSNKKDLNQEILSMVTLIMEDQIDILKIVRRQLNDEINIIRSIFSTEHDQKLWWFTHVLVTIISVLFFRYKHYFQNSHRLYMTFKVL